MDQIDNYKIIEKIGVGGMGEVYKGIDVMLEREVAIKLLRPELSSREDIVQRFRSEAILLGKLNHPNIATVYNFGKIGDQYYMALEYVNGETLDSLIQRQGALPWQAALDYTIKILEGLAHAHGFNIVHRDIKPSNIIVNNSKSLKILDFGIARILETARLTKTGHLVGTMEYVSPEQIRGQETDARSDIYSVGIALYEMLTGHVPFQKNTEYELIKAHVEEKPKPLKNLAGIIPNQLENIVLKALEKKPEHRFKDANDFSKALQKIVENTPSNTNQIRKDSKIKNFITEYPGLVFLFGLMIIGSAYIFWDFNFRDKRSVSPIIETSNRDTIVDIKETLKDDNQNQEKKVLDYNMLSSKPETEKQVVPVTITKPEPEFTQPDPSFAETRSIDEGSSSQRNNETRAEKPKQSKPKSKKLKSNNSDSDWQQDFAQSAIRIK
ncbi:serine/threonine protein kinase [Methylomonas rhizoryzae]|uniref:serine/threonine protein kinase n=1 Tax=Methylomonas rhizoryzae TaxID=2608981 RepID=UPI00123251D2|nr:serine/threonine-protein kinase [Methylomonas rhizoryzae]